MSLFNICVYVLLGLGALNILYLPIEIFVRKSKLLDAMRSFGRVMISMFIGIITFYIMASVLFLIPTLGKYIRAIEPNAVYASIVNDNGDAALAGLVFLALIILQIGIVSVSRLPEFFIPLTISEKIKCNQNIDNWNERKIGKIFPRRKYTINTGE